MDRITLTRNCDVARYNDQAVSLDARESMRNRKYNFDRSKKKENNGKMNLNTKEQRLA